MNDNNSNSILVEKIVKDSTILLTNIKVINSIEEIHNMNKTTITPDKLSKYNKKEKGWNETMLKA